MVDLLCQILLLWSEMFDGWPLPGLLGVEVCLILIVSKTEDVGYIVFGTLLYMVLVGSCITSKPFKVKSYEPFS